MDLARMNGRTVLVTGACGHLGMVIAETMAEAGARVALTDRDQASLEKQAEKLASLHGAAPTTHACNLADEAAVRQLPDEVVSRLGRLDVVFNNAAFVGTTKIHGWATDFEHQTSDSWRKAMEVNVTAAFELCQSSMKHLRAGGNGCIVNIASIYGLLGPDWSLYAGTKMANPAAYAASKGALIQLTRWLSTTVGPEVRVNCISPGGIARGQPESFTSQYVARTPLRRMAREDDFKGAALFLASDLSRYVTGQNLVVDGGWSVW